MSLSEQDREDVVLSAYSCYRERHPGTLNWLSESDFRREAFERLADDVAPAVERIVARHVRAALTEAADRIEAKRRTAGLTSASDMTHNFAINDAARIIRNLSPDT